MLRAGKDIGEEDAPPQKGCQHSHNGPVVSQGIINGLQQVAVWLMLFFGVKPAGIVGVQVSRIDHGSNDRMIHGQHAVDQTPKGWTAAQVIVHQGRIVFGRSSLPNGCVQEFLTHRQSDMVHTSLFTFFRCPNKGSNASDVPALRWIMVVFSAEMIEHVERFVHQLVMLMSLLQPRIRMRLGVVRPGFQLMWVNNGIQRDRVRASVLVGEHSLDLKVGNGHKGPLLVRVGSGRCNVDPETFHLIDNVMGLELRELFNLTGNRIELYSIQQQ